MEKGQTLSEEKQKLLDKIKEYERLGKWNEDVEVDPPSRVIMPNEIDYLNRKLSSKYACHLANKLGKRFFDREIKNGNLIIDGVEGFENYEAVKDKGVIITCNHFNVVDQYVAFKVIEKSLGRKRLWKVIKEGNYTSVPGLFGRLLRHCNTLPLSSNVETMKLFMQAIDTLLGRGEKILIYPEQAMWWNYKKPRPLKPGAFKLAVRSKSPVLPFFITMEDSDKLDADGACLQRHTVHIMPAIFPDETKSDKENVEGMMKQNYEAWKAVYEKTYGAKL